MSKIENLKGKSFGYLKVISIDDNPLNKRVKWICKCKCGKITSVFAYRLKSGETKSCGCKKFETHNQKHGMKHTRIYEIWCGMKKRCYNPHSKSYKNYGKRGISVCDEWLHSFEKFYDWAMANGYNKDLQIDRIDPNGNYSPENCKWSTHAEQQQNKTNNVFIEHNGQTKIISEWCRELGFKKNIAYSRHLKIKKSGRIATFEEIFAEG